MNNTMKLQNLINEVESKKLILPDFQRKFVWKQEDMCSLFASILCQMPFGSILTLESDDNEFSCKKFGAKPRVLKEDITSGERVEYLIDGQQRLTSLFAGFTTYYYTAFKNDSKKIAANQLLDMYFLKIPAETSKDGIDLFNAQSLSFDGNWENEGSSYFSCEEVKRIIDSQRVSKIIAERKSNIFDIESQEDLNQICAYCCNNNDGFYRIPLQFVLHNKGLVSRIFNKILNKIAISFLDDSENSEDQRTEWVDNVKRYLLKCLDELQLNKIPVKNSDKARAIDIYSNLNKGGVALNVFDLIMAKVGRVAKENFYDTLVGYIQKNYQYPDDVKKYRLLQNAVPDDFCATKNAEILNAKDEIAAEYINNFLNILSLYIAKQNGKEFSTDLIKQDAILNLDAKQIVDLSSRVCEAMDRALFFFQTRCGIRKLSDINYKAEFAVVAYFFTNDDLFSNNRVHDLFEYWYWVSLFAYMYPSNQNVVILNEIPYFEKYFSDFSDKSIFSRLDECAKSIMKFAHYSDKETLTMKKSRETETAPASKMTDFICQFYMAKGYKDFFINDISINYLYQDALETHHLLPLGSDPNLKIGESTKTIRKDKYNKYNSPLNMLYITKTANKAISDMDYTRYTKDDRIKKVINGLGCITNYEENIDIDSFLNARFDQFESALNERIQKLRDSLK